MEKTAEGNGIYFNKDGDIKGKNNKINNIESISVDF